MRWCRLWISVAAIANDRVDADLLTRHSRRSTSSEASGSESRRRCVSFFSIFLFFIFFFWVVTPLRVPPFLIFFTFIFSFFCMCVCACVAVVAAAARLPSDVALSFTRLFQEDPSASLAVEARQTASEPDADFVI